MVKPCEESRENTQIQQGMGYSLVLYFFCFGPCLAVATQVIRRVAEGKVLDYITRWPTFSQEKLLNLCTEELVQATQLL